MKPARAPRGRGRYTPRQREAFNVLPLNRISDADMQHFTLAADLSQRLGVRVQTVAAALVRMKIAETFDRTGRRVVHRGNLPAIAAEVRGRG